MLKAVFFDLDGVLCDTSQHHFQSWKLVAEKFNFDLTVKKNEKLKGLNRKESVNKILSWADVQLAEARKEELIKEKNNQYLKLIDLMTPQDLNEGVLKLFHSLRSNGVKIGLGASTSHAVRVLDKLDCIAEFDAIVDGNMVKRPKPDAEVFELLMQKLDVQPEECVVLEDSPNGFESSKRAKIKCVAMGNLCTGHDACCSLAIKNLSELNFESLAKLVAPN
ncbi:MAG: Beta-phosphoglucomutase [Bacteroidetes bacterium MED-G17]|nr:MAG: Beta-phosphoglucomutase [Bacteroidetes bacterium MED-G17]|tara:strand:- start:827 stop:1489 length:663 start_codon:yes stop_codon:yes gene_type:complete